MRASLFAAIFASASVALSSQAAASMLVLTLDAHLPGTITTTTCTEAISSCSDDVQPATYYLIHPTAVDDLATGSWDVQEEFFDGNWRWSLLSYSITSVGMDQWGNSLFEARNISVTLDDVGGSCRGGLPEIGSCHSTTDRFSLASAPLTQVDPAPLPEPNTWAMMLLGFGAAGMALRQERKRIAYA